METVASKGFVYRGKLFTTEVVCAHATGDANKWLKQATFYAKRFSPHYRSHGYYGQQQHWLELYTGLLVHRCWLRDKWVYGARDIALATDYTFEWLTVLGNHTWQTRFDVAIIRLCC